MIITPDMTASQIVSMAQNAFIQLRTALGRCGELYSWSSGVTADELSAAPVNMDPALAQALINAIADSYNEYVNHFQGLPATMPASGYKYGASQSAIIGAR